MEYYDCIPLSSLLQDGVRVTETDLREIAASSLLGLDFLHSHGIVDGVIDST